SDRVLERAYHTKKGTLTERLRYVFDHSTLIQEKFLIDDPSHQMDAFEELLRGRRWRFLTDRYVAVDGQIGDDGYAIAGEVYSPLKLLHFSMNPIEACYLLTDQPDRAATLMAIHEEASLDLVRQMVASGVKVVMSMDNLDTMFHPPRLVEQCSASFYERASHICHEHGSHLFIHACGRQKANLALIASLGVDGLEGVAFPTLGDVELDEAMRLSGDRLIITGGISALEFERLQTRQDVFSYIQNLFKRIDPYSHRFVLSASCNTPFTAPWETLVHFRDAWLEYGRM
ncbi:MAG: uroporphyrinogen decarboxylase family protein, partial [Thermoleophilia bacterium]